MAPRASIPDSSCTQLSLNKSVLSCCKTWGSSSSWNTLAKTSSAAAEHFPINDKKAHIMYVYTASSSLLQCALYYHRNLPQFEPTNTAL